MEITRHMMYNMAYQRQKQLLVSHKFIIRDSDGLL